MAHKTMELDTITPESILPGARLRSLDPKRVAALKGSIEEIGLQTPLTVWVEPVDPEAGQYNVHLVSGLHRLEAVKQLGWDWVECFMTTADEHDRQLIEIDENLIRAELTELEVAAHHKRRKEILEARGEARKRGGDRKSNGKNVRLKSYADDASEKLGVTSRTVRRAVHRAEQIDPDVQEDIKGTSIADSGVELDALADMTPGAQAQAVEMVKAGDAGSIREAGKAIVTVPQKKKRRGRNAAQERAHLWRKLKEALENLNGMPDVTTIISAVPAAKREMVTTHLPFVADWLDDFRAEWAIKQAVTGDGDQGAAALEMRAITRAWDRISDDARKAFVAEVKERGSL